MAAHEATHRGKSFTDSTIDTVVLIFFLQMLIYCNYVGGSLWYIYENVCFKNWFYEVGMIVFK